MSDAQKTALAQAKAQAAAKANAAAASGQAPVLGQGTGPLGLPAAVSVLGVNVPSIFVLGLVGVVVLAGVALAIHAVRSK